MELIAIASKCPVSVHAWTMDEQQVIILHTGGATVLSFETNPPVLAQQHIHFVTCCMLGARQCLDFRC